jgi:hypothetical protein
MAKTDEKFIMLLDMQKVLDETEISQISEATKNKSQVAS